jgi:hypothetical protein
MTTGGLCYAEASLLRTRPEDLAASERAIVPPPDRPKSVLKPLQTSGCAPRNSHHGAQKSTMTGSTRERSMTRAEKSASFRLL